jgi:hypothetical protein
MRVSRPSTAALAARLVHAAACALSVHSGAAGARTSYATTLPSAQEASSVAALCGYHRRLSGSAGSA